MFVVYNGWKTFQVVDLLCQEGVHGEVSERTRRHELRRNFQALKRIVCIFPQPFFSTPLVNNKHHICDSLIDLPCYDDKYSYQKYLANIWRKKKKKFWGKKKKKKKKKS